MHGSGDLERKLHNLSAGATYLPLIANIPEIRAPTDNMAVTEIFFDILETMKSHYFSLKWAENFSLLMKTFLVFQKILNIINNNLSIILIYNINNVCY